MPVGIRLRLLGGDTCRSSSKKLKGLLDCCHRSSGYQRVSPAILSYGIAGCQTDDTVSFQNFCATENPSKRYSNANDAFSPDLGSEAWPIGLLATPKTTGNICSLCSTSGSNSPFGLERKPLCGRAFCLELLSVEAIYRNVTRDLVCRSHRVESINARTLRIRRLHPRVDYVG